VLALPAVALAQLADDPHRPKYHFLPAANWMNDPNGPIFWRGRFHMFYQYNPNGAFWGSMHWGHAYSADMVHWKHLPVALAPTPGGYDKDGVFSGCAVDDGGVATLLFTGTKPEVQCLATSTDPNLLRWKKLDEPVIAGPPEGLKVTGFRDPCVWRDADKWYMALGSGFPGVGGAVLLYTSPDLRQWSYIHPLFEGKIDPARSNPANPVASGEMWECPTLVPLGDKHLLFVSTQGTTPYYIGTYRDYRFTPEISGARLDYGAYYAPITQLDDKGRRILWGWIQERRSRDAQKAAGWSGVLSLPRVLDLKEGRLSMEPAPQLRALRGARQRWTGVFLPDNRPYRIPDLEGDALELVAEIDPSDADECGLQVFCSPDGDEQVSICYHAASKRLWVGTPRSGQSGNLELARGEPLRLDVFIDCSVIEVFANGRTCVTERAYPKPANRQVRGFARAGSARLRSLIAYELKPISADRMTT
jgi:beta-fructofuranosidase